MEYGKRFKEIRIDRNISQATVDKAIGTTQQQIYKYESGKQEMTGQRIIDLCNYYQVSADYILGLPKGLEWPR